MNSLHAYFIAYFQAYFILDEFLLAGEIQETSKKCVLNAIKLQVLSLSGDNTIRNASVIEHIFISLQNTAIINAKMLSAIPNQDFVMEEETPHGVFEDAGLG